MVLRQCIEVFLFGKRPLCLRFDHGVLTEIRQLSIAMLFVEVDDVFERFHRRTGPEGGEIFVQICFEFVKQYFEFRVVELTLRGNVSRIDDGCSQTPDHINAFVHQLIDGVIETERFALHTDARPFQSVWIEERREIVDNLPHPTRTNSWHAYWVARITAS